MIRDQIIAIDQGTTSTRAIRFAQDGTVLASASQPLAQTYPQSGRVESDPEEIWAGALSCLRAVIDDRVAAIGIANQRETIILWDRDTGRALHNAVIWQDRRTVDLCAQLVADGMEPLVRQRTGLLLDPYFSAGKLGWLLDHVPGAMALATQGRLAAGTVDSFLLWRLTGGRVHATDMTNAARTSLFNIHTCRWDPDLLSLFDIPAQLMPTVHGNVHEFGQTDLALLGRSVPITGMAGDQQAALVGQGCFSPGTVKSTYGTGCFMLAHTGATPVLSDHRLLTTLAYSIGDDRAYAMEGSIFVAGAAVKWLRDRLGIIPDAGATAALAAGLPDDHGVHLVPAFVGLGAPYWRRDVRAALTGLTLDSGPAHIARAALESVAFQTSDLTDVLRADGVTPNSLRIDGGMAGNDWFAQFLADMLNLPVDRPGNQEATALGAARLAALGAGIWPDLRIMGADEQPVTRFVPAVGADQRHRTLRGWRDAVCRVLADTNLEETTHGH